MELPAKNCVQDSRVRHLLSDRSRSFVESGVLGTRATDARQGGLSSFVTVKTIEFSVPLRVRWIRCRLLGWDFGIDTRVPNMLYGSYTKCSAVGGKLVDANIAELKALPGIVGRYKVPVMDVRELLMGVGIVGTSTWAVFEAQGLKATG